MRRVLTSVSICIFLLSSALTAFAADKSKAYKEGVKRESEENAEKRDLLLVAGLQSVLDLGFKPCEPVEQCVKVVNAQLLTVQYAPEKKQLIFTPIKNGETTVSIRDENGELRLLLKTIVSSSNLARALREIKELLRDIEGIEFKVLGNKIVADGEVIVPGDLNRVMAVLSDGAYKDLVMNLISVSPLGQKILAKRMQDEINNPKVTVRVMNETFVLEGTVDSRDESERIKSLVLNMMPLKVEVTSSPENMLFKRPKREPLINLLRIAGKKESPPPKLVRLTVNMVELAKSYGRNFGFSWQPGLATGGSISFGQSSTGGVTSASSGALSGTISNLFPKLASAQSAGYVRVLQETTMITQSGKKAHADRKQKFPVAVVDKNGNQNFQAVDVGIDMNLTPTVSGQDVVTLDMSFSYSSVVGRLTGNAPPITAASRYTGFFNLKSNESAAVVNLISNDLITDFNKDSPSGQTPVDPLFSLIRSKAFTKNKSQFVIFVTPQLVEGAASGTEDIKRKYGIKKRN